MNIPVSFYFEFISLVASVSLYFRRDIPLYLKLFPPFLFLTLVVEIIGWRLSGTAVNASLLYYLFSAAEFVFYLYVLHCIIRTDKAKRVIFIMMWGYPVLALVNIFFIQDKAFPSLSYSLGCLLIVGVCIYYFYELFHLPSSVNLVREPAFWICTGLLFFYTCSFPLFGLYKLLYAVSRAILEHISTILIVMNTFLYTLFTTAFLCGIRRRKPLYK